MAFPYQLRIIQRQQQLIATISQGGRLEQLALGMYLREWREHLREVYRNRTGLPRHLLPRVEQALHQLENLVPQAHSLPWQQVREHLLEVAALLGYSTGSAGVAIPATRGTNQPV